MKVVAIGGILLILTLPACTTKVDQDVNAEIYNTYSNIKSYAAEIELIVESTLSEKTYSIKQQYKAPNMFRADTISPEYVRGTKYVVSSKGATLFPPFGTNQLSFTECVPCDRDYVFLPDFLNSYYKNENSAVYSSVDFTGAQTVLELKLNSGNPYRFEQKLWIDNKTLLPAKMVTYDVNKKPVLTIIYKDFKLNEKIADEVFE